MQSQPVDGRNIVLVAIHRVVDHRMFFLAQVDPDLIAAAGVKPQLQQCVAATAFHHLVVRHGQLAAIISWGGKHTILAIATM